MNMPKRINRLKLPPIKPERKNILSTISGDVQEGTLGGPKDYVRLTPEVDYILEQNKKKDLQHHLLAKRKEARHTHKQLAYQWKALEQKELSFQRTIITHNRFLRRNLEKRERALMKIQNDIELNKKRTRDINSLSQKYVQLKESLVIMRNEIMKHSIYENYLKEVMRHVDSPFKMLFEFLIKFEALLEVKEYCVKRQYKEMSMTIKMQNANIKHFRLQNIIFIGLKNELSNLGVRYDETVRRNLASELLLRNIIIKTNELNDGVMACQFTIDTIYKYICYRRGISPETLELRHIQPKVDEIKRTLVGYAQLMPSLRRRRRCKDIRRSLRKLSVPMDELALKDSRLVLEESKRNFNTINISTSHPSEERSRYI